MISWLGHLLPHKIFLTFTWVVFEIPYYSITTFLDFFFFVDSQFDALLKKEKKNKFIRINQSLLVCRREHVTYISVFSLSFYVFFFFSKCIWSQMNDHGLPALLLLLLISLILILLFLFLKLIFFFYYHYYWGDNKIVANGGRVLIW